MANQRLHAFDYFRAASIILVVITHCFPFDVLEGKQAQFFTSIIWGATTLFVFMSGFFFEHLFIKNFKYEVFMRKKFENIFLPYFFLSTVIIAYTIWADYRVPEYMDSFNVSYPLSLYEKVKLTIGYLITGRALMAYWYIPFIMIMFALSPVFIKYTKLTFRAQLSILVTGILVSLFVQRPEHDIGPFWSLLYFYPVYLLGIFTSKNLDLLKAYLKGKSWVLFFLVIIFALMQSLTGDVFGNYRKTNILDYMGVDFLLLQKVFTCLLFVSVMDKLSAPPHKFIKRIADVSFGLFFLHSFVLFFIKKRFSKLEIQQDSTLLYTVILFVITFTLSYIIAVAAKRVFGKESRHLIGW